MTVRQLLASLDSAELSEWMAYLHLERERNKGDGLPEPDVWQRAFNAHG